MNRMTMLYMLTNLGGASISINKGIKGPLFTVSTACSTGASAIIESYKAILLNEADIMVACASDETANPVTIHSSLKFPS